MSESTRSTWTLEWDFDYIVHSDSLYKEFLPFLNLSVQRGVDWSVYFNHAAVHLQMHLQLSETKTIQLLPQRLSSHTIYDACM